MIDIAVYVFSSFRNTFADCGGRENVIMVHKRGASESLLANVSCGAKLTNVRPLMSTHTNTHALFTPRFPPISSLFNAI